MEVKVEETVKLSDKEIDDLVKELKAAYAHKDNKMYDIARKIAKNSKDYLDTDTYLWVMYVFMMYFKQQKKGVKYPYARMRYILDAEGGYCPKPEAIIFKEHSLSPSMVDDIYEGSYFMDEAFDIINKRFFRSEILLLIAFIIILVVFVKLNIIFTLGIAVIVFLFNYFFTYKKLRNGFIIQQTQVLMDGCDDIDLTQFDNPVFYS